MRHIFAALGIGSWNVGLVALAHNLLIVTVVCGFGLLIAGIVLLNIGNEEN